MEHKTKNIYRLSLIRVFIANNLRINLLLLLFNLGED